MADNKRKATKAPAKHKADSTKSGGLDYVKVMCYICSVLHIFFIAVDISLPAGTFMPSPYTEIHAIAMVLMCLLHSWYSLGFIHSVAFLVSNLSIEWYVFRVLLLFPPKFFLVRFR